jgi:hypothetical protein
MPQVEVEPTIPVFEQAKTFHALDRAATVIGCLIQPTEKKIYPTCSELLQLTPMVYAYHVGQGFSVSVIQWPLK